MKSVVRYQRNIVFSLFNVLDIGSPVTIAVKAIKNANV